LLSFWTVRGVSRPFDGGRCVEIKLEMDSPMNGNAGGELYLRIAVGDAYRYPIGSTFAGRLTAIP
jgi:hypothetical protein